MTIDGDDDDDDDGMMMMVRCIVDGSSWKYLVSLAKQEWRRMVARFMISVINEFDISQSILLHPVIFHASLFHNIATVSYQG